MTSVNSHRTVGRTEISEFIHKQTFRTLSISFAALLVFSAVVMVSGNLTAVADSNVRAVLDVDKYTSEPATINTSSGDQVVFTLEIGHQSQEIHFWDAALTYVIPAPHLFRH